MTDALPRHVIDDKNPAPRRFTHVRLLADNDSAWKAKRHLIAKARYTLDLSYFILEVDSSTSRLLLDLIDAAARGIEVRLLVDYFTTFQQAAALRTLSDTPRLQVRRYGLPSPVWLKALDAAGIDARGFVVGLMAASGPMLADSLKGNTIFGSSTANNLRLLPQLASEGGVDFSLQVPGTLKPEPSGNGRAAKEKIALLLHILRGLKQFLHRNHHKLLLADGRWFVMGGRNLSDAYHCINPTRGQVFQDTDLLAHDGFPRRSPHADSFNALWESAHAADIRMPDPLDSRPPAQTDTFALSVGVMTSPLPESVPLGGIPLPDMDGELVDNLPRDKGDPSITHAYIAQIQRLQATDNGGAVDIVSAYLFLTDDERISETLLALRNQLLAAAAAGLTVNIYTNSLTSTDLKPVNRAAYPKLAALIDSGVNVFELDDGQGSLHTKAAAIGNDCLIVGSYNMDPRSELYDTNNLIVLHDPTGDACAAFRRTCIAPHKWKPLTADEVCKYACESPASPADRQKEPNL